MNKFDENHIKNIVLVGGAKSGKTTLAETMLYEAQLINRRGSVENKNTVSDYHLIEQERGLSVYATPLHTEWRNYKINIIDTPGLDDFIGEIISSLRVAETCVMLVNSQHGVEVGTELIWNHVDKYRKPVIFAVNQVDHENSNFEDAVNSLQEHFGQNAVIMQYPYNEGKGFNCIIDLLKMTMYKFPSEGGKPEKLAIPQEEMEKANALHNELVEKAAENDEELMELYFDKGHLNEDEMRKGLKAGMMNHEIFPIFCLSAGNNMGSGRLMGFIDNVAPSSTEMKPEQSQKGHDVNPKVSDPTVLFVFRTEFEPKLGKISFFKVLSGTLKKGAQLKNSDTHQMEIMNQLFVMDGKSRNSVDELVAGDLGATLKLKNTDTNQTLHALATDIHIKPIEFPQARLRTAVTVDEVKDDERLTEALRKLMDQDPTLQVHYSKELKQMILKCQGELHLATIKWNLEHIYNLKVSFHKPRIPYRETIQRATNAVYRHKKQSGGAGQFAEVHMRIEPYFTDADMPSGFSIRGNELVDLEGGGKLQFINAITGGSIDTRFIPSVLKGVMQCMEEGPLTGSYVRDVRVILYDGKMHPVDSNDMAFQIAGMQAFRQAFKDAQPKLLEPIYKALILVPEEQCGEVMTDLQTRRAVISGMDTVGRYTQIHAQIPLANLHKYTTSLPSLSQGRASYTSTFHEYGSMPPNIQEEIIQAYESEEEFA